MESSKKPVLRSDGKIFLSIADAARYMAPNDRRKQHSISSGIIGVCKGRYKIAHGFEWRYLDYEKDLHIIIAETCRMLIHSTEIISSGLVSIADISRKATELLSVLYGTEQKEVKYGGKPN